MTGELWLEDIHVGHRFRTDVYDLTADDIIEFATKWDPQPFHLSDETAQDTFFQGLAGSGWHTAAITMRLLVTSGIALARGSSAPAVRSPGLPRRDRAIDSMSRAKSSTCTRPSRVPTADLSPSLSIP